MMQTSATDAGDFSLKPIVGVLNESFEYPNTALVGATFDSQSFNQIPRLSVELKGLKFKFQTIEQCSRPHLQGQLEWRF